MADGDRSVTYHGNASGNVAVTGDHNQVTTTLAGVTFPAPETVDIARELAGLRALLAEVALEPKVRKRVDNALEEAEAEAASGAPDRQEIGEAVERAVTAVSRAGKVAEVVTKLRAQLIPVAGWLGTHWHRLVELVAG